MKLSIAGVVVGVCVAVCGLPVHALQAASSETPPDCTNNQLIEAQKIIADHEIEKTCTTLKIDANGVPDLTNLAFCSDKNCTKTIKRVRKSMPSCLYNGKRLRAGMTKLVKACEVTATAASGDDDAGSASSNTPTATSKTKKPKKTATPAPSTGEGGPIASSTGSSDGALVGTPIADNTATIEPATEAPTTTPVTQAPATAATSPASSLARRMTLLTAAVTLVMAFLC